MATHRYTADQLVRLRESPLVQKPAHLPSIKQWIEDQGVPLQTRANHTRNKTGENVGNGDRNAPRGSLTQTRNTTRGSGEVVLGPPKLAFSSSSRFTKDQDVGSPGEPPNGSDSARPARSDFRERFGAFERQKPGDGFGRGTEREAMGRWGTSSRKTLNRDDGDRSTSWNADEEGRTPRGGTFDEEELAGPRFGRRAGANDGGLGRGTNGTYTRGSAGEAARAKDWRVKEPPKEDSDFFGRPSRGPAWMNDDSGGGHKQRHTVEDIEAEKRKFRQEMGLEPFAEDTSTDKANGGFFDDDGEDQKPALIELAPPPGRDFNFEIFGAAKPAEAPTGSSAPPPAAKPKASRFAGLFGSKDPAPQFAAAEEEPHPQQQPQQPAQPPAPSQGGLAALFGAPSGANPDQEGMNRILQMLQSQTVTGKPIEQRPRPESRDMPDSRGQERQQRASYEGGRLISPDQKSDGPDHPPAPSPLDQLLGRARPPSKQPEEQLDSNRDSDQGNRGPPQNLGDILNVQRPQSGGTIADEKRDFLLNLMRQQAAPSPAYQQRHPQPVAKDQPLPDFFRNPQMEHPQAGPLRPPPGFANRDPQAENRPHSDSRSGPPPDMGGHLPPQHQQQQQHQQNRPPPGFPDRPPMGGGGGLPPWLSSEDPNSRDRRGGPDMPPPFPPHNDRMPPPPGFGFPPNGGGGQRGPPMQQPPPFPHNTNQFVGSHMPPPPHHMQGGPPGPPQMGQHGPPPRNMTAPPHAGGDSRGNNGPFPPGFGPPPPHPHHMGPPGLFNGPPPGFQGGPPGPPPNMGNERGPPMPPGMMRPPPFNQNMQGGPPGGPGGPGGPPPPNFDGPRDSLGRRLSNGPMQQGHYR